MPRKAKCEVRQNPPLSAIVRQSPPLSAIVAIVRCGLWRIMADIMADFGGSTLIEQFAVRQNPQLSANVRQSPGGHWRTFYCGRLRRTAENCGQRRTMADMKISTGYWRTTAENCGELRRTAENCGQLRTKNSPPQSAIIADIGGQKIVRSGQWRAMAGNGGQ